MRDDATIRGRDGRFPSTRRSLVQAIGAESPEERRRAFDALLGAYWKPVYAYLRLRWRLSSDDAQDVTQGFFARSYQGEFLDRFDPTRARFRTWLRVGLDGFVANERKAAGRWKRGGRAELLSLDFATAEVELGARTGHADADPDALFRREWVRGVFEHALAELRAACDAKGKATAFALFERYDLQDPPSERPPRYAELAGEFDLPVTQVTNLLAWARREFRARVLDALRRSTASDAEFRAEARDVLGSDPL